MESTLQKLLCESRFMKNWFLSELDWRGDPSRLDSAKVKASKSIQFTKGSPEVELKSTCFI